MMISAYIMCYPASSLIEEPAACETARDGMAPIDSSRNLRLGSHLRSDQHGLARLCTQTLVNGRAVTGLERLSGPVVNDDSPLLGQTSAEGGGNAHQIRFVYLVLRGGIHHPDEPAIAELLWVGAKDRIAP